MGELFNRLITHLLFHPFCSLHFLIFSNSPPLTYPLCHDSSHMFFPPPSSQTVFIRSSCSPSFPSHPYSLIQIFPLFSSPLSLLYLCPLSRNVSSPFSHSRSLPPDGWQRVAACCGQANYLHNYDLPLNHMIPYLGVGN